MQLQQYDVTALDQRNSVHVNGGDDFTYALGYTVGQMIFHPVDALRDAITFYGGG